MTSQTNTTAPITTQEYQANKIRPENTFGVMHIGVLSSVLDPDPRGVGRGPEGPAHHASAPRALHWWGLGSTSSAYSTTALRWGAGGYVLPVLVPTASCDGAWVEAVILVRCCLSARC